MSDELKDKMSSLRFAKSSTGGSALLGINDDFFNGYHLFLVKINKESLEIELQEEFEMISLEDLSEELPENTPR